MTVIGEEDGIEAHASEGRALIFPEGGGRFEGIVEGDAERVVSGFDEGFAGGPVDPDGRLAGAVSAGTSRAKPRRDAAWGLLVRGAIRGRGIVDEGGGGRRWRRRWGSGGARRDGHGDYDVSDGRDRD